MTDASATRRHIPGYGLPEDTKGLLDVSHGHSTGRVRLDRLHQGRDPLNVLVRHLKRGEGRTS